MKILTFFLGIFIACTFLFSPTFAAPIQCNYDGETDVKGAIDGCLTKDVNLVATGGGKNFSLVSGDFKTLIKNWVKIIGGVLALAAVGGIVYGSFLMVVSQGDEEKFSKAKEIVKWSLIGFLALVSASALVAVVVSVMYGI